MKVHKGIRTGGRSARVQKAVHEAVHELLSSHDREALTVPMIAQMSGVTPSTIYRRWGDLPSLLADAALDRLRPDDDPVDTGALATDLKQFAEAYLDETGSELGKTMLRDVVASGDNGTTMRCAEIARCRLAVIVERAQKRGQWTPSVDQLVDGIIAPMTYRILFDRQPPTTKELFVMVDRCLIREKVEKPKD
ncbi:TetR/AcrR family transcriptional regulator [Thalassospira sp. MCCC 1A03138]|uniref:TetR/AcrR family transcriptional regulator n=1 Tax=Thalassospira sp. MCCC 1A03138 TaxID=1470576 RepID=UPI000A1F9512|nr:TetR/AcrR family transcriptional regulator [Thalassospira sp. MCCC 1A03138]OSQ28200.1 TetR family transcriptional regulator [Thalassospira sp. MCCC 1A03138]